MRCTSHCTASSYEIPKLFQFLLEKGPAQLFRNVIHIEVKNKHKTTGDVFYFSYGVVVCFGLSEIEEKIYLSYVKKLEKEPNSKIELDEFTFAFGDKMTIEEDEIVLQNKSALTKLTVAQGLAQSAKLTTFEEMIQQTINLTKNLPKELARKGKISLSRKEISKKM